MFSTDHPQPIPSIIPLPGESLTAAIFRQHDRFARTGLTDTDQVVVIVDDHAATQRALDEALKLNAAMQQDRDRLRQALTDANALIVSLQDQLAAVPAGSW